MANRLAAKVRVYGLLGSVYLTPKEFTRTEAAEFIEEYQERQIDRDDLRLLSLSDKVSVGWNNPVPILTLINESEYDESDLPFLLV